MQRVIGSSPVVGTSQSGGMADAAVLKTAESDFVRVRLPPLAPLERLIMARKKQEEKWKLVPTLSVLLKDGMIEDIIKICRTADISVDAFTTAALAHVIKECSEGRLHISKPLTEE